MKRPLEIVTAVLILMTMTTGCATSPPATQPEARATGDAEAVALAERVMDRLGGRPAWERTRTLRWTFFGRREHVWDKHTGDITVSGTDEDTGARYVVEMNLHTGAGRSSLGDEEITDPGQLSEVLEEARRAWINDSYWLVMPYKLLDPGVTLRHLGERDMLDGRAADVLELTFDDVGVTPENKYHVYVARDTGLVEQWDFFPTRDAAEPRFQVPWHDWQRYGRIMLSGDRGRAQISGIEVSEAGP